MTFSPEQLTKAKQAKSAEELLTLAKESGIEMTADEAAKYFAELNKQSELSDDELDMVAGGGKGDYEAHNNWTTWSDVVQDHKCPVCGAEMNFVCYHQGTEELYEIYSCDVGGVKFEKNKEPDHRSTWRWFRFYEN